MSKPAATGIILQQRLRAAACPRQAAILQWFFKTGPGDYGEGDRFLGVRVPAVRKLARQGDALSLKEVRGLLHSEYHEERLLALLILVRRFERGEATVRARIFRCYLAETRWINQWDLVDVSAPHIVGAWLLDRPREVLDRLVQSPRWWERRIAILATFAFLRRNQFQDTLRLCERLLGDPHDLIHKACGWMLCETGKRQPGRLRQFLAAHATRMPRTMLRYAIEKLPAAERRAWRTGEE